MSRKKLQLVAAALAVLVGLGGLIGFVVWRHNSAKKSAAKLPSVSELQAQQRQAIDKTTSQAVSQVTDANSKAALYETLASNALNGGDYVKAQEYAKQALDTTPADTGMVRSIKFTYAEAYARQNNFSKALEILTPLVVASPAAADKIFQTNLATTIAAYKQNTLPTISKPCEPSPDNNECKQ